MATLKSLLNSDFVTVNDPFVEYFSNLPKWKKGDTDYIALLAGTVQCTNKGFWDVAFKKWLVNMVACAVNKEIINHQVLVFVGGQGIGKSTWLNKLVPKALDGYLYTGIVNPSNKDTLVSLAENLLINLDELENLNKTELGSLKSLITLSNVRLRKAYGYHNENFTRRASFVGSVNEVEFLTDTTGNRRYLVIQTTDIDYLHALDLDKVYSQAYALYKGKFEYFFGRKDIASIDANNEMFLRLSVEEELLLKHYRLPEAEDKEILELTTTDIIMRLQDKTKLKVGDSASIRRLGMALQKHEYPRVSRGNSKPYQVVVNKPVQAAKPAQEEKKPVAEARPVKEVVPSSDEVFSHSLTLGDITYEVDFIPHLKDGAWQVSFIENEKYEQCIDAMVGHFTIEGDYAADDKRLGMSKALAQLIIETQKPVSSEG
jgi:predicted P-loop ATPase